nr:MAG: ORF1 [TTV-like mini virus]
MPWYYNNYRWRRPWRPRRRRRPWRRPRRFVRRRFYRRHRWVRRRFKRKLKSLLVKQYQPPCIRRLKIRGHYPLFMTTHQRLSNNNTLYLDSTGPRYVPGGGGFSLSQFTLRSLFQQHLRLRNWWTQSNDQLPLIRYTGCKILLYRNSTVDYIFSYNNNLQAKANRLMYASTQPAIMNLTKHKRIVPCKQYNRKSKPYTKIRIKVPPQMKNTWYFQHDIVDIPLITLMCTACSLDRWYLSSTAISPTIGLTTLNCQSFQFHNFKAWPTSGYKPSDQIYLYGCPTVKEIETMTFADLIYLGNTNWYQEGKLIKDAGTSTDDFNTKWSKYFADNKQWGNIFHPSYFTGRRPVLITSYDPQTLKTKANNQWTTPLYTQTNPIFHTKTTENVINCRYNPYTDTGTGNAIYLLKLNNPTQKWDPPEKPELIGENLPLWCLCWGYLDYQRRAGYETDIDTNNICVIKTKFIEPHEPYYCFLDNDFLTGTSPYRPQGELTTSDKQYWHPKVSTQIQSINEICSSGPGTVKLPKERSVEASMSYCFYFKLGGDPPPMELITDPEKQPKWPIPSNLSTIPSLQSPETAITNFLYKFDQRGDFLTKTAIARLKKDSGLKETLLPITGGTFLNLETETPISSQTETSDEEKEEPTLQLELLRHRRNQRQLKRRINQLLEKLSKLE